MLLLRRRPFFGQAVLHRFHDHGCAVKRCWRPPATGHRLCIRHLRALGFDVQREQDRGATPLPLLAERMPGSPL